MSGLNGVDLDKEEVLATFTPTEEQKVFISFNEETGQLDLPLSMVRDLARWLQRYDMRPRVRKSGGR